MALQKENKNQIDKILIITHHFAPYTHSLGGISRVLGLVNYLVSRNVNVYLLAAKGAFNSYFGYQKEIKKINIYLINDPIKHYYDQLLQSNKYSLGKKSLSILAKFTSALKRLIANFIIPDLVIFLLPIYVIKALILIEKRNIKYVYISSPPHSLALVGYVLKLIYNQKIILIQDYRDSWNMTNLQASQFSFIRQINSRMEKEVLKKCDYFIYASKPMLVKLILGFNFDFDLSKKSLLMLNGFTRVPAKDIKIKTKKKKIDIGYFGSLSNSDHSYRNIQDFIELIKINNLENGINLHLFGSYSSLSFKQVPNFLKLHGNLNHSDALNFMAKMDYLLLVHTDPTNADEVITGKFFDYISAERPIISFSPLNLEANRLIKQYNLGHHFNIFGSNKDAFAKLIPGEKFNLTQAQKKSFHRNFQYRKMIKLISS